MDDSEKCGIIMPWKEPINGKKAFFTEEVYCQVVGPEPSLESKVSKLLDDLGFAPAPLHPISVTSKLHSQTKQFSKMVDSISSGRAQSAVSAPEHEGVDHSATQPSPSASKNTGNVDCGRKLQGSNIASSVKGKNMRSETRSSSLSHEQHIRYLNLFKKCTQRFFHGSANPPTQQELQEIKEFEFLQVIVAKEQEEFQVYLHQMAEINSSLYHFLVPHAQKYISEKEQSNSKRAELYPRHYVQHSQIPLTPDITQLPHAAMTFKQTLLTVGQKSKVVLPELKPSVRCIIPFEAEKIKARFPPQHYFNKGFDSWNHQPVSQDKNVEDLLQKYPCQVIATANALTRLLDNHLPNFATTWEIPIIVRQNGKQEKVVFLDKPLNPKGLKQSEKKTLYLQKALRAFLCHPQQAKHALRHHSHRQGVQESKTASALADAGGRDLFETDFGMEDLETFGSDRFSLRPSKGGERVQTQPSFTPNLARAELYRVKTEQETCSLGGLQKMETHNISSKQGICDTSSGHVGTESGRNCVVSDLPSESATDSSCVQQKPAPEIEKAVNTFVGNLDQLSRSEPTDFNEEGLPCTSQLDNGMSSDDDMLVIALTESKDSGRVDESTSVQKDSDDMQVAGHKLKVPSDDSEAKANPGAKSNTASSATRRMTRATSKLTCHSSGMSESNEEAAVPPEGSKGAACTWKKRKSGDERKEAVPEKLQKVPEPVASTEGSRQENKPVQATSGLCSTLDSILQMQRKMLPTGESIQREQAENPAGYLQPERPGESISYNLWNLAGIAVMVRCSNHGFRRDLRLQQCPVYIVGKPERQVLHGLEQLTVSEMVKSWLACYLRPGCHLVRARVNMQNNEIVHLEELPPSHILQPSLNFSAQTAFSLLKNIFTELLALPAGSYLLSHDCGADGMTLKAGTGNKRSGYDLHFQYMGFSMSEQGDRSVPWVPVDPTLILPHHWQKGLIPATFSPPDFHAGGRKQVQMKHKQQHQMQHKKKNKKKKKQS